MKIRILITCLFLTVASQAQVPFFHKVNLSGISSNVRILTLCQDSRKVIWLGTSEGLFHFDGYTFVRFQLPDSLASRQLSVIAPLPREGVIVGTRDGLVYLIKNNLVQNVIPDIFHLDHPVSALLVTGEETTWIGTLGGGLLMLDKGKMTQFGNGDGRVDNYVYSLVATDANTIWMGTDGGLTKVYQSDTGYVIKTMNTASGLPENIVRTVVCGPENTLGIGMEEKGFCMFDLVANEFHYNEYFRNWNNGPVTGIAFLENEFWIGTPKSGILDYEFRAGKRIRWFSNTEGFPGLDASCMLKDHEGNIWIGCRNDLYMSPGEKIEYKRSIGGEKLGNINTLLIDSRSDMWFSNENGLHVINRYRWEYEKLVSPLANSRFAHSTVISLYEDKYGFIWAGTFDDGVIRINPLTREITSFGEKDGLINMNVLSIDGDDNEIWFATLGGVSRCTLTGSELKNVGRFTGYSEENGLGNNFIYKVFIDSKKRAWFGTDGRGITCYENGKFINYNESNGLKSKIIYSVTEDNQGNIWFSSVSDGIYRFDGKQFMNFNLSNGLRDLNISALATDNHGNLIVVHKKGIDVIYPQNFHVVSYGSEVGLIDIDPDLNVIDTDNQGNTWIGIRDGIVKLLFASDSDKMRPVICLDRVLCMLQPVDTSGTGHFSYNENHMSFGYFGIWYSDPERVSYQYKLEGYNSDWITTRDKFVTYPRLAPGTYKFMVRSSHNGNFDDAGFVSYAFTIAQPFWKTAWFLILVAITILILAYVYLKFRDKRIQSAELINRERVESQFEVLRNQVNPHFLFNSFNTLITVIEEDRDVAVEYVNKLSDFFRSVLTYRDKNLIPLAEELRLVQDYVFLQQKRYGKNFSVRIVVKEEAAERYQIPPMTLQTLVENALKHNAVSSESPLTLEMFIEQSAFLVVKNNINPRLTQEPSTGLGLTNIRKRYNLITGKEVEILEQNGYFIVRLPLIKKS